MNDHEVVGAREGDGLLVDRRRPHRAHRVGGKREDEVLGGVRHVRRHVGQVRQEVVLGGERVVEGARAGEQRRVLEDGVARVGHQAHVAGVDERRDHVPQALLGAAAAHHHVARDAGHAEAALVVAADGVEQLVLIVQRVLPVGGGGRGRAQRLDHVGRGLEVRRAHREVEDLPPGGLQLAPPHVERGEHLVAKQVEPL